MENATKALLIAAAVLIVIILVALGISLLNSSGNVAESADKVGEQVTVKADDVSKETLGILDDISNKNLIKEGDIVVKARNQYYQNYTPSNPKILLEPNTKYILSFDYKINYADAIIGCGIGYGKTTYSKDILYSVTYPNQIKGTFSKTFITPSTFNTDEPYLRIRLARMNRSGDFEVEIKDIRFKKLE